MNRLAILALAVFITGCASAPEAPSAPETPVAAMAPRIERLQSADGATLEAHIFDPGPSARPRPAVIVFHGGGWHMGDVTWAHPRARHYAERGMVGVAAQYRLSDQAAVSPIEAVDDALAHVAWVRANAERLNIDPTRIAIYGWSAGGHLAAAAALAGDRASRPDALVLWSPAVDLESDGWFARLLGDRGDVADYSPLRRVRAGMPPTLILQGDVDTVTPVAGAQAFCSAMRAAGNVCELEIYRGFGHLFTPAGRNDSGNPETDPATAASASRRADDFLEKQGFMR